MILQFGGSLAAILILAGLAYWLKLGGKPRIADHDHAAELAGAVSYGFRPVEYAIDADGAGALLADSGGQIMVLKRHGAQFAGRILTPASNAWAQDGRIVIDSGERRYGSVSLHIPDQDDWIGRIKALKDGNNA